MSIHDCKHVVAFSTNTGMGCEHCDEAIGLDRLAASINHYIQAHGYTLLHVGSETHGGDHGEAWHDTVAVLGHENPPAAKPEPIISMFRTTQTR